MEELKARIQKDGHVRGEDILKVDSFLNHQIDVAFLEAIGAAFHRRFSDCAVTKILTIEASGIGIACITAQFFRVPVLFAKKNRTKNIDGAVYRSEVASFTHGRSYDIVVAREFLSPDDRVLLIDDFLANGHALRGLWELTRQAGAHTVGAGIVIEKAFQPGGEKLRAEGLRIESLARIRALSETEGITFA